TVQSLGTEFDIVAGQVSSRVWNTDIENAVDGIEIGGRNLILDSEDLTQFNTNYSSVVEVTNEDMTEEWGFSDAYRFKLSGATTSYSAVWTSREYVSEPMNYGQLYTHSMYVKNVGTNDFYIRQNGLVGGSDITIPVGFSGKIRLTGVRRDAYDWYQIRITPLNTGEEIELIAGRQKLEKGTKATDWTPAPEDTDAKINHIETEWTQTFDTFSQTVAGID